MVGPGSPAIASVTPTFAKMAGPSNRMAYLLKNGVLVNDENILSFSKDYLFSAPSAASDIVLGGRTNGRFSWKDIKVRTLKESQAAEATH